MNEIGKNKMKSTTWFNKSQIVVQDCRTSFDLIPDRNTKLNKLAAETEIETISISQILKPRCSLKLKLMTREPKFCSRISKHFFKKNFFFGRDVKTLSSSSFKFWPILLVQGATTFYRMTLGRMPTIRMILSRKIMSRMEIIRMTLREMAQKWQ